MERRLAAIFAADMVGYSRLMAADEAGTLARLKRIRSDVIDPEIAGSGGEIVKLTGDGMLVLFRSVAAAVEAATAVQKAVASAEAGAPADHRIAFRIGLHLGDVMLDGGEIYGDGVNIAARLEGTAEPGGITLSDDAFRQVRGKTKLSFIDLGELNLKNIPAPMHAHKVDLDPAHLTQSEFEALTGQPLELPDKPSIAVLPFQNMSGDPEQGFFADGMTEDIITILGRVSDMVVMSRTSTFAYKDRAVDVRAIGRELGVRHVLEGSVRRVGNRGRIAAQLIEAETGDHVWAERYDRDLDDIFEVQDEITREIVTALSVRLSYGDEMRVWTRSMLTFEGWQAYNEALEKNQDFSRESNAECIKLCRRMIAQWPEATSGKHLLGFTLLLAARYGFVEDPEAVLEEVAKLVEELLATAPLEPTSHALDEMLHLAKRRFEPAVAAGERTVKLAPGVAMHQSQLGIVHHFAGRHAEALNWLRKAIRSSPYFPATFLIFLSGAYRAVGDLPRARIAAEKLVVRMPNAPVSWVQLACVTIDQGEVTRASEAAEALLSLDPAFKCRTYADRQPYRLDSDRDRLIDSLVRAGLPE